MPQCKPVSEIPAARTRRVLGKLALPQVPAIVWTEALATILIAGLLLVGLLVAGSANEMVGDYVESLRTLWEEP